MNSIFEYQETPGKRGRPKKEESQEPGIRPRNAKGEEVKWKSVFNPVGEKEKQVYARNKRISKLKKEAQPEIDKRAERAKKVLEAQDLRDNWEAVKFNKHGTVAVNKEKPEAGRIFIANARCSGSKLHEEYFPELYEQAKLEKRIKGIKRRIIKKGITPHQLRMQGASETVINSIFDL